MVGLVALMMADTSLLATRIKHRSSMESRLSAVINGSCNAANLKVENPSVSHSRVKPCLVDCFHEMGKCCVYSSRNEASGVY